MRLIYIVFLIQLTTPLLAQKFTVQLRPLSALISPSVAMMYTNKKGGGRVLYGDFTISRTDIAASCGLWPFQFDESQKREMGFCETN